MFDPGGFRMSYLIVVLSVLAFAIAFGLVRRYKVRIPE